MSGYICGVYIGQYKVLLELSLKAVPQASGFIYAWHALVAGHAHDRMGVPGHVCMRVCEDGWMVAIYSVASLAWVVVALVVSYLG